MTGLGGSGISNPAGIAAGVGLGRGDPLSSFFGDEGLGSAIRVT